MCLSEDHIIGIKLFLKELLLTKQTIIFNFRIQIKRSRLFAVFLFSSQCFTWEYSDHFKFIDVDVTIIPVTGKFQVWLVQHETPALGHSSFICLTRINNVLKKVQMPLSSLQSRKIKTPWAIWLPWISEKRF